MHARWYPEPLRDSIELFEQTRMLGGVEILGELGLEGRRELGRSHKQAPTGGREVQRVRATIVRAGTALEQSARLELVDQRDHPARRDTQPLADRLLGAAFVEGDSA